MLHNVLVSMDVFYVICLAVLQMIFMLHREEHYKNLEPSLPSTWLSAVYMSAKTRSRALVLWSKLNQHTINFPLNYLLCKSYKK